ncbi:glutamate--cysteine ligase [Pyxidicoccus fallax]|uniref:Glutamate--cysteine ligase n=1 Tax=Pyxidicoccus fallax TaxID=394095 RepID=A0A848LUK7_9BACT|nr:glutamate--cysteine ligase [Pyxidicoccus fallax]NMO21349.1 glutamate--cysteine ligase [Pyxidicoccus fallax]NPC76809.1 glutamate--cysteine ligase [Pyxidicoccus fallax]
MGLAIQQEEFVPEDYARFSRRLAESLEALRQLLARPGFGVGKCTIGAELEMSLVDAAGFPLPVNRQVLSQTVDPRVTLELDRFNLEVNLRPGPLAGRPFTALREEFEGSLGEVRRAAATQGARVAVVGILPTLREADLGSGALTGLPRYRALSAAIRSRRATPFHVSIHGPKDALALTWDDVTLEGANTSLQYHLRVAPADFARMYNAAQLATAPVLAVSSNSPLFLGRRLWDETRIALFRQAVDDRGEPGEGGFQPHARVTFGHGWVREGAHELFAESVALHPPLLPVLGRESPLERVKAGGLPGLDELRLHQSTVWTWNRAIYDPKDSGHLRIELRALPAGPSVVDMVANGAFLLGLTLALAEEVDALLPALPFVHACGNFIRAARQGLDAELLWPADSAPSPRPVSAVELASRLLPVARRGLVKAGVDAAEADALLGIIERRVALGRTGARWQLQTLERLEAHMPRLDALAAMLERYLRHADSGEPVHTWPLE